MLVRIRAPFTVHRESFREFKRDGRVFKEPVTKSHFFGEELDLDENEVRLHFHKLEPVDESAVAFFDKFHAEQLAARKTHTPAMSATQEIAAAVVQALLAGGLVRAQK